MVLAHGTFIFVLDVEDTDSSTHVRPVDSYNYHKGLPHRITDVDFDCQGSSEHPLGTFHN